MGSEISALLGKYLIIPDYEDTVSDFFDVSFENVRKRNFTYDSISSELIDFIAFASEVDSTRLRSTRFESLLPWLESLSSAIYWRMSSTAYEICYREKTLEQDVKESLEILAHLSQRVAKYGFLNERSKAENRKLFKPVWPFKFEYCKKKKTKIGKPRLSKYLIQLLRQTFENSQVLSALTMAEKVSLIHKAINSREGSLIFDRSYNENSISTYYRATAMHQTIIFRNVIRSVCEFVDGLYSNNGGKSSPPLQESTVYIVSYMESILLSSLSENAEELLAYNLSRVFVALMELYEELDSVMKESEEFYSYLYSRKRHPNEIGLKSLVRHSVSKTLV